MNQLIKQLYEELIKSDSIDRVARTHNTGFAIARVPCFADTLVQGGSSVLRMKFSTNTPRHRKPPNRYPQC